MNNTVPGRGTPPGVVIPFFVSGAVAFSILCLLLFFNAESLTTHYFNPHLLSIVHTAALGWGTMVIFGAAHQLLPVISERDLYSPACAMITWYTLCAGTILLVFSFRDFRVGWIMITGGSLVVLSVVAYLVNVVFTVRPHKRDSVVWLFLITSSLWLLFTVVVGLLLAINLSFPFFEKNHLEILKLHAHAGIAGWFLQLITGVSARLVPMFLLGKSAKERLLYYAFALLNAGLLLFLTDGYFLGILAPRITLYGLLVGAGIVCWLLYLYDTYQKRMRKKIDFQMKQSISSFAFLIIAVLMLPVVAYIQDQRWAIAYGGLLFMGWITGIILGKTFKTLPFIVWNMHYKEFTGKPGVPVPGRLYSEDLIKWQYRFFLVAALALFVGVLANHVMIIRGASVLWVILSFFYLYNILRVVLHNILPWNQKQPVSQRRK